MLVEIQRTIAQPGLFTISGDEASAAARAVMVLFTKWNLTDAEGREILGGLSVRTYARWKAGDHGRISRDLATRLSLLMGIHKGLRTVFGNPGRGYAWVRKPNDVFGGRSPAEVMAHGGMFSLARVRAYLDAERGGW